MSDLMAFLRARLDEDEAAAKAAVTGEIPQQWRFTERWQYEDAKRLYANRERALREVEAMRAILADYNCGLEFAVLALTAIWRDHPDYDQVWGGGAG